MRPCERREMVRIELFCELPVWIALGMCAAEDIRRFRIPNGVVALGMAVCFLGSAAAGWTAGGLWGAMASGAGFAGRAVLVTAAAFPMYMLGMTGAGDIKVMAWLGAWMGLGPGLLAIGTGLVLGAVLALLKLLYQGSMIHRFLYLKAYIGQIIQQKMIIAYYNEGRDGHSCVIPLGACFCVGAFLVKMWS